jgi:tetratricopeptide (TPR) repeat protein
MHTYRTLPFILILTFGSIVSCGKEDPQARFDTSMKKALEFIEVEKWDEARISLMNAIEAKGDDPNSHYQLAEVFMRLKKIGPAIDQYETTINLDPSHRDARIKIAAIKLGGNQIEAAQSDVEKLLEANPDDTEARLLQASIYKVKNKLPQAREILEKLIAQDAKNHLAVAALGDVFMTEGDIGKAEELFSKALEIEPSIAAVRLALADLYVKQNRLDDAQEIVQNLLAEDPSNTSLRYYLGEFLLARGSGEKATEQYVELLKSEPKRLDARDRLYDLNLLKQDTVAAKALTAELAGIAPDEPGTLYFKGRDLELDGKTSEAYALYMQAIRGLPGFSPLFRRAGMIEMSMGKVSEAIEHLNQAVIINPADVGARLALGRHYFLSRDLPQAKEHVSAVLRFFPRQIGANLIRADIALVENRLEEAEEVYKALAQTVPNNPVSYFKLAALEEKRNNLTAAIGFYQKGLSFDKDVMLPAQRMSQLIAQTEGGEKALEKLEELKRLSTHSKAEYDVIIGTTLLMVARGDTAKLKQSREYLSRAVEAKPELLSGFFSLAQLDSMEGKPAQAEDNYRRIIERQPNHLPSRMLLAMSLEARGELESALEQYRKILEINPNFGAALNNIAWVIASSGKGSLDEALNFALKAKEKMPNVSAVADTLGWIYYKRETPKAALPILEEALELERKNAPKSKEGRQLVNPEILYHLAVVQSALDMKEASRKSASEALALPGIERTSYFEELKKLAQ